MADCRVEFRQIVTNREIETFGEDMVRELITLRYLDGLVDLIRSKIQFITEVCPISGSDVDYTLAPFQLSEQFGVMYRTSLVVMTPDELADHDQERCQKCQADLVAEEVLASPDAWTC